MGFLRRWIQKKGAFPPGVRSELERERVVLLAEGIPGRLGRNGRRGPGTLVALALTQQRLAIYAMGEPLVDVTWDSGDARELDVVAREDGLTIGFDADRFAAGGSGRVELDVRIGDAPALLKAIDQRRRELKPRRPLRDAE